MAYGIWHRILVLKDNILPVTSNSRDEVPTRTKLTLKGIEIGIKRQ
jgi:hypothetical protein